MPRRRRADSPPVPSKPRHTQQLPAIPLSPINSMIPHAFFSPANPDSASMVRINWRLSTARDGEGMADFRFVIGALLAVIVLGVTSFGLLAAVRLTHQPKVGPLETARGGFDDRAEWNQFND